MGVLSLSQEDPRGGGHGIPLQYSCLENPTDRGAWQATAHGVTKSWTPLSTHVEKAMAPHSSTLAWKIPWAEEPGRLQVHGVAKSQTRLSDFIFSFHFHALEKEMATHSSVLAWKIPGTVGCHLWGRTESDTTEAT